MIWRLVFLLLLSALPTWAEPFRVTVKLFAYPDKSLDTPLSPGKPDKPVQWAFSGTVYLYDQNGDDLRSGDLVTIGDYSGEQFLVAEGDRLVWRAGKDGQRFTVLKEKARAGEVLKHGQHPVMLQIAKGKFLGGSVQGGPAVTTQPMLWMMARETWGSQAARRPYDQAVFGKGGSVSGLQKVELLEKAFSLGAIDAAGYLTGMYEKGEGVPGDRTRSTFWARKGAEAGEPESMKTLAYFLPPAEGIVWLKKAADLGHFQAKREIPDYEKIHATVLKPGEQVRIGVRTGSTAPRPAATARPAWKYPVGSILRNVGTSNPGCTDVYVEAHSTGDNLYYVLARYGGAQRSNWTVQTSPSRVFKQGTIREEELDKEFKLIPGARYCKKCEGTGDYIVQQIRSGHGGGRFHYGEWKEYTSCKDCSGTGFGK